ncbi:MAG TPA: VWA domain-containing protein [Pyrinomonadaceae bacterium]|nr:VWA domain-containing protein [Pyrinomonadaceae bacterium]
MRHTPGQATRARALAALALCLALVAGALLAPPPLAAQNRTESGRPRRVSTSATPATTSAARPAAAAQTAATPRPTPTPQSPAGAPKLQVSPQGERATPEGQQPGQQEQEVDPDEVVRVESSEIRLNVRVVDRQNRPVGDVTAAEFRVFENGVQQTVESITKEEVPISYGLVVDNSGSMRNQIGQVIEAAKTIVNSNKPGDETFIVRFVSSDKIELKQDFTADKDTLVDVLDNELLPEGGKTAVIDAVYLAAEHAAEHKKGNDLDDKRRRALIIVTDGEERKSTYERDQLFDMLRETDVQLYVIGFVNELDREGGFIRKSPRAKAVELVERMAKETGGRAFFPNSLSELPQIASEIAKDLRTQYVISYNPTDKRRDGSYRAVRVTVEDRPGREKRVAITRAGYSAPREGGAAAPATGPARTEARPPGNKP